MDKETLVSKLKDCGVLKTPRIESALSSVDRAHFVPEGERRHAYLDEPLPIGSGQTISQPFTVVFMLELLDIEPGMHVLEVGSGSGWQTVLLAHLVGKTGEVHAIELVPALCRFGALNVKSYPDLESRISFYCQDAAPGLPDVAKRLGGFDRIIAAAAVNAVPHAWRDQLKTGGVLVYPSRDSLFVAVKRPDGSCSLREHRGFAFVPFISGGGM